MVRLGSPAAGYHRQPVTQRPSQQTSSPTSTNSNHLRLYGISEPGTTSSYAAEGTSPTRRQIAPGLPQSLGAIRLARLLGCADGGHPEVDLAGDAGESQRIGALVVQAPECEVDALDLP